MMVNVVRVARSSYVETALSLESAVLYEYHVEIDEIWMNTMRAREMRGFTTTQQKR